MSAFVKAHVTRSIEQLAGANIADAKPEFQIQITFNAHD